MQASMAKINFAAVGVPVQSEPVERLPLPLIARKIHTCSMLSSCAYRGRRTAGGGCTITVDTTAPEDKASWYDIWAAAVAIDGMCVRNGRTGKSRFLGMTFFGPVSDCLVC